jgi:hypothetical protein
MHQVFGMGGMVENLGEVGFEKVEVAGHGGIVYMWVLARIINPAALWIWVAASACSMMFNSP